MRAAQFGALNRLRRRRLHRWTAVLFDSVRTMDTQPADGHSSCAAAVRLRGVAPHPTRLAPGRMIAARSRRSLPRPSINVWRCPHPRRDRQAGDDDQRHARPVARRPRSERQFIADASPAASSLLWFESKLTQSTTSTPEVAAIFIGCNTSSTICRPRPRQ